MNKKLILLTVASTLGGCATPGQFTPAFRLEVGGDVSSPINVEFHEASGFAITRPADQSATGEGDVNLGVPGGLSGRQAVDLIQSNLPGGL